MPFYPATNNVADLDPATPAGSDKPSELDNAIREVKLVVQTAFQNGHKGKGGHRAFTFGWLVSATTATGTVGQWNRLPLATQNDPTNMTAVVFANSICPTVPGTYWIDFYASAISCGTFQARVAEANGNTLSPSASVDVVELRGGIVTSSNTSNYAYGQSRGSGLWTTDGTKSLCLDLQTSATGSVAQNATGTMSSGFIAKITGFYLGDLT